MLNSSDNQSLPAAYGGQTSGPANNGDLRINQSLLDYLTANTQSIEYLMAVPSSMQGADYVIATERPVLYVGGFSATTIPWLRWWPMANCATSIGTLRAAMALVVGATAIHPIFQRGWAAPARPSPALIRPPLTLARLMVRWVG